MRIAGHVDIAYKQINEIAILLNQVDSHRLSLGLRRYVIDLGKYSAHYNHEDEDRQRDFDQTGSGFSVLFSSRRHIHSISPQRA
jgi:hypothetical protein